MNRIPIFHLVEEFERLCRDGYCEEDILGAFIAQLERQLMMHTDEDALSEKILTRRINDLKRVAEKWYR